MYEQVEKSNKDKSKAVVHSVTQKKADVKQGFGFVDKRPDTVAQRKLQAMADNYSAQQKQPIQKKENNTGLPGSLKSGIENLSGYSMDDVKVHYNSDKPTQLQAYAYAQRRDIHIASGQEKHLAHEAWHVVQQKQRRVEPTMQMKGYVNINNEVNLEKEADVMGDEVINQASKTSQIQPSEKSPANFLIQKKPFSGQETIQLNGLDPKNETYEGVTIYYANDVPATHKYGISVQVHAGLDAIKNSLPKGSEVLKMIHQVSIKMTAGNTNGATDAQSGRIAIYVSNAAAGPTEVRSAHPAMTGGGHALANDNMIKSILIHEVGHVVDHEIVISDKDDYTQRPLQWKTQSSLDDIKQVLNSAFQVTNAGVVATSAQINGLNAAAIQTHTEMVNNVGNRLTYQEAAASPVRVVFKTSTERGTLTYSSCTVGEIQNWDASSNGGHVSYYQLSRLKDHIAEHFTALIHNNGTAQGATQDMILEALGATDIGSWRARLARTARQAIWAKASNGP